MVGDIILGYSTGNKFSQRYAWVSLKNFFFNVPIFILNSQQLNLICNLKFWLWLRVMSLGGCSGSVTLIFEIVLFLFICSYNLTETTASCSRSWRGLQTSRGRQKALQDWTRPSIAELGTQPTHDRKMSLLNYSLWWKEKKCKKKVFGANVSIFFIVP